MALDAGPEAMTTEPGPGGARGARSGMRPATGRCWYVPLTPARWLQLTETRTLLWLRARAYRLSCN